MVLNRQFHLITIEIRGNEVFFTIHKEQLSQVRCDIHGKRCSCVANSKLKYAARVAKTK